MQQLDRHRDLALKLKTKRGDILPKATVESFGVQEQASGSRIKIQVSPVTSPSGMQNPVSVWFRLPPILKMLLVSVSSRLSS